MPPFPGEERLVTVFADIHYYFAQPTVRPLLHRFDKASYFYIYYNSTRHTSRIEVANNPGTPDQDAFNGYIDSCHITNSFKFPTLLTIVVDGATPTSPSSPKAGRDPDEWSLASKDPRDANRQKYRLHTLDLYFWAQEDARLVIECFKKLLPSTQLDVAELEPERQHEEPTRSPEKPSQAMSPVVQNLENMAVHDTYNDQVTVGRSAVSPSLSFASYNLPPPPSYGASGQPIHSPSPAVSDMSSQPVRQTSTKAPKPKSTDFTPMAYNPAAPAAPEPIAYREKTPPPEDSTAGTGLMQAAKHDQAYVPAASPQSGYRVGQGPPVSFGGGYAAPLPQHTSYNAQHTQQSQHGHTPAPPASSGGHGPPPPSTAGYNSPPPPSSFSQVQIDQRSSMTSTTPSFGPRASSTISHDPHHSSAAEHYIPQPGSQEPVMTPGSQFYNSLQQPPKPLAHVQPQYADYLTSGSTSVQHTLPTGTRPPPMGGYSQYDYRQGGQAQQQQQRPTGENQNPYDVHQQVYRPTEAEENSHHKKPSRSYDSRKESRIDKAEKGVGRLFKKIEKKIG